MDAGHPRSGRLNTHDIRVQGGHPALAHETIMGRWEDQRKQPQTTQWHVHAYLYADDPTVLPVAESVLDGLQFGGKRNYGYGKVKLKDRQMINLNDLDYFRLEGAETYLIGLVPPFVLAARTPPTVRCRGGGPKTRDDLRLREEQILACREVF